MYVREIKYKRYALNRFEELQIIVGIVCKSNFQCAI